MINLSTIGYEASSIEDFIATLQIAEIKTLIDVRQVAISRRKGFSKRALQSALEEFGIEYVHLAGLGDPKEGRVAAKAGRFEEFLKIFSTHMKTPEFNTDLRTVAALTKKDGVCLMCYERLHNECHRKLVSGAISAIVNCKIRHLGVHQGISRNGGKAWSRARSDTSESITACG